MINMFIKSLKILKNNLLLIQPILIYMFFIMSLFSYFMGRNMTLPIKIILLTATILAFTAFLAGWLYSNKLAIADFDEEDSDEKIREKSISNLKKFFEGVGANFLRVFSAVIIVIIVGGGFCVAITGLCYKLFGTPQAFFDSIKMAEASSQAEKLNIMNAISKESMITFAKWVMVLLPSSITIQYFFSCYLASVMYEKRNIFYCFFKTIKTIILNILPFLLIIIVLQAIHIFINLISVLLGTNVLSFIIYIIMYLLYLNYSVILIFNFYNEKTKDNSDSRPELVG